jgi:DNA-binding NtrC family response regulator
MSVLIIGESGTGKVIAKIHENSEKTNFIAVDCGSIQKLAAE